MCLLSQSVGDRIDQRSLCHVFVVQRGQYRLIEGVVCGQVGDRHRLVLSLAVEPRVGLLVELQGPGQGEPDQEVAALLEVEPVPG